MTGTGRAAASEPESMVYYIRESCAAWAVSECNALPPPYYIRELPAEPAPQAQALCHSVASDRKVTVLPVRLVMPLALTGSEPQASAHWQIRVLLSRSESLRSGQVRSESGWAGPGRDRSAVGRRD